MTPARYGEKKERRAHALVVGAGVSGCACAAALASRGVWTTLVNSALDVTGMPGYGPVLSRAPLSLDGMLRVIAVLDALPRELRCAWLSGALLCRPEIEHVGGLIVDPRAVSLRVKWVLEQYPRLWLRQALVTSLDPHEEGGWVARSAFGEEFRATYVVLAVGLSLAGRLTVGSQTLEGGRYGEVAADALRESLQRLGVRLREGGLSVGYTECATFVVPPTGAVALQPLATAGEDATWPETVTSGVSGWSVWLEAAGRWSRESSAWEAQMAHGERGPAPLLEYSLEGAHVLRPHWALRAVAERQKGHGGMGNDVALYPAGLATSEWAGATGGREGEPPGKAYRSRLGYEVRADVIKDGDEDGRIPGLSGVWAVGRVAGASSYVESLASGVRAAAAVATAAAPVETGLGTE